MVKASILIVDDTIANLQLLSSILVDDGYEARPALNGRTALSVARAMRPDLILLDISMPDMDGYSVCQALKADPSLHDVPVIFISALSETIDKVRAFHVGGVDYITKPFHVREVLARVETQLRIARQHQELQQRCMQIERLQGLVQQFVSQAAWERIAADAEGYDGPQVRYLTVMFTDIAGYTALSERSDVHRLVADLSLYMGELTNIIYDYQGEVDKYLGDGILAFFSSARHALEAAFAIQRSNRNLSLNEAGYAFPTRVGLATGDVLFARLGGDERREYTLIGDRVNVASRLQGEVSTGGIIMDEATYLAAGMPAHAEVVTVKLKGKAKQECAYTLQLQ